MIRYPKLIVIGVLVVGIAIVASHLWPDILEKNQVLISIALILALGIPHGATDFKIFKVSRRLSRLGTFLFVCAYIFLMLLYGVIWWFFPLPALMIFLGISFYHFGQSNWHTYPLSFWYKNFLIFVWGAYVILTPVILHWKTAREIVASILRRGVPLDFGSAQSAIAGGILAAVCMVIFIGAAMKYISGKVALLEIVNVLILYLLFYTTPLLIGFTVYFVFWHSVGSARDQILAFRQFHGQYKTLDYVRDAMPFSILAIAGTVTFMLLFGKNELYAYIGYVFVFISMLTLPHIFLIENLIEEHPIDPQSF